MQQNLQKFGRRVARLRKEKGWSQEKLALESGIARSYLGGVERGQRNISLVNICRLAETLGIRMNVLMDFDLYFAEPVHGFAATEPEIDDDRHAQ